jgi:hypothetical protein
MVSLFYIPEAIVASLEQKRIVYCSRQPKVQLHLAQTGAVLIKQYKGGQSSACDATEHFMEYGT